MKQNFGHRNQAAVQPSFRPAANAGRRILYRTAGRGRGGITRLVSSGDLGEHMKPFIFLDLFDIKGSGQTFPMHLHSGIATVTVNIEGAMHYRESTGAEGILPSGGVEWMSAGNGVWHTASPADGGHMRGFQLWLALPADDENGPAHSQYLAPEDVPCAGPARVVIGTYAGVTSPLRPRAPITYLQVTLSAGERWSYVPPAGHDVGWLAVAKGTLLTAGTTVGQEVLVFEDGEAAIDVVAQTDVEFVLGLAARHPHELVSGSYSVHTTRAALEQGEQEIARLGRALGIANI
jgi:redox-sensitive bicupin YhaK (pirin superfamily)